MKFLRFLSPTVLAILPLAAGCDGASSARESVPRVVETAAAVAVEAPAETEVVMAEAVKADAGVVPAPAMPPRDSSGVYDASFDDVKFEMDKAAEFLESMLTPKVRALIGQRMRIRGYMYPTLRKRGLTQFVLVRDNLECCFGPGAALYDCILVTMSPGKTAEFSIRPIAVEGTFRFEPLLGPDRRPMAIYQMTADLAE